MVLQLINLIKHGLIFS